MCYLLGFIMAIVIIECHITLHELSHALMAKAINNAKILRFKPWPHVWQGRFYMGRIEVSSLEMANPIERCYFYGSPLILNSVLLFVYALIGSWAWLLAIVPLTDSLFWLTCAILRIPNNDGSVCMAAWREHTNEYSRADSGAQARE